MNVEIGNPAYKIYEGEPDDDAGELLDADFTLDPDKVEKCRVLCRTLESLISLYFSSKEAGFAKIAETMDAEKVPSDLNPLKSFLLA